MYDGGPAFPCSKTVLSGNLAAERGEVDGMTLRDWFAGKAMAGMLSDANVGPVGEERWFTLAVDAYNVADCMLKARGDTK